MGQSFYKKPRAIGFYPRKIVFFAVLGLFVLFGGRYLANNYYQADLNPKIELPVASEARISLEIGPRGQLAIDGKKTTKKVQPFVNYDELRLPVMENPGRSYDRVVVTLRLPDNIAAETKSEVLAIHGAGQTKTFITDSKTVGFQVLDVSPYATISIIAQLPKGYIRPGLLSSLKGSASAVEFNVWLIVAISLPVITCLYLFLFILLQHRSQHIDIPAEEAPAPPMAIPPALVGVLIHQKVRAREVAATLVDLAVRGDIVIIDRERGFAFGKGKFDQRLLGYEKILLTKIFRESLSADRVEIEKRINSHFYSRKISLVSAGIYALTTRMGYFKTNPQRVHTKYKTIGLFALLIGLIGFALSLFVFSNQPYIAFLWVGMMIAAVIIIFVASHLPIRTPLGRESLANWYSFRNFLSSSEPIIYSNDLRGLFERYLPYAIVLDCEAAWAKRFAEHNFQVPDWFLTDKNGLGLDDFCLSLFPIISYVSRSLVALREPGFE